MHGDVVRCGDAQKAACCECFACDGGLLGTFCPLLSTPENEVALTRIAIAVGNAGVFILSKR